MYEQNVLLRSYKSFKHTFNHALLESKISGTMFGPFFAQWWVLDLTSEPLRGRIVHAAATARRQVGSRSSRSNSNRTACNMHN